MTALITMYDAKDYASILSQAENAVRLFPDFFREAVSRDLGTDGSVSWAKSVGPADEIADSISAILTRLTYAATSRSGVASGEALKLIAQAVLRTFPLAIGKCSAINTTQTPKAAIDGEKVISDTRAEGEKIRTVGFRLKLKGEKDHILGETVIVQGAFTPQEHLETRSVLPAVPLADPFTDHDRAIRHDGETAGYARGLTAGRVQADKAAAEAQADKAYALVREAVLSMLGMLAMMPNSIGDHAWSCPRKTAAPARKTAAPARKTA